MFIIGTGTTFDWSVPRYRYRGNWFSCAAARAVARETARIAFAPSRSLFGVPSSSIMVRSRSSCSRASKPRTASLISLLIDSTAPNTPFPRYRPASPSRRSTASCSPVEAPLGTAAYGGPAPDTRLQ